MTKLKMKCYCNLLPTPADMPPVGTTIQDTVPLAGTLAQDTTIKNDASANPAPPTGDDVVMEVDAPVQSLQQPLAYITMIVEPYVVTEPTLAVGQPSLLDNPFANANNIR